MLTESVPEHLRDGLYATAQARSATMMPDANTR